VALLISYHIVISIPFYSILFYYNPFSSLTDLGVGAPAYWEERYIAETKKMLSFELFDWYVPFTAVYPSIESIVEVSMHY
jgi:hypothetical protein